MENKTKAGVLAMLCILGMGFAWGPMGGMAGKMIPDSWEGPPGGMAVGELPEEGVPPDSWEGPRGGMMGDIPLEVKAQFMQAEVEGDYEAAVALHEEHGIGGRMMRSADEEVFALRAEMFGAMLAGDYEQAVLLREEMRDLVHEKMQELMPEGADGNSSRGMGMRGCGKQHWFGNGDATEQ